MAHKKSTVTETPPPANESETISPGGFNHRDEGNALISLGVRNGSIEGLHAGKYSPLLEDPILSRIADEEMKAIMINATFQLAKLLQLRDSDPEAYRVKICTVVSVCCRKWERESE